MFKLPFVCTGNRCRSPVAERAARRSSKTRLIDAGLWFAAIALVAASLVMSLSPQPDPSETLPLLDKLMHALGYGSLAAALLLAVAWRPGRGPGKWEHKSSTIVIAVLAFSIAVELGQAGVPGRMVEGLDVVANAAGIALAHALWRWLRRRFPAGELT